MRRIRVVNFTTLDGVVQSPLAADEDTDDGFTAGGWVQPFMDEVVGRVMGEATTSAGGLLLGRRTYEKFAEVWSVADQDEPAVAALNDMPKHVVSTTLTAPGWRNSHVLRGDPVAEVTALKGGAGGDLVVFGSSALVPTLAAAGLVDGYTLLLFPLVLGVGSGCSPRGRCRRRSTCRTARCPRRESSFCGTAGRSTDRLHLP